MIIIKDSFENRLQIAINKKGIKPIELSNKTNIDKSLISCYLSGKYKPGEENLSKIAKELEVSEIWLRGYDVPMGEYNNDGKLLSKENTFGDLNVLYDKVDRQNILSDSEKDVIKAVITNAINRYEDSKKEH